MNKPISTMMHGVLDYITAPTLLVLPRALGWSERITGLLSGAGLGVLGYSVLTRYELGLLRVLPMKVHPALDMASGGMLAISPFVLLKKRERTITTVATLIGLGVYEIAAGLLTQPQSPIEQAGGEYEIDTMPRLDQPQPTAVS
jgi:hypothetical protein